MNPNTTTTTTTEEPPCPPPVLIGMGNPLLDISAEVDEAFLKKYGLEANNAILAEEKHMPLYEEMIATYPVRYIAGGAAQSTLRGAQWLLPKGSTGFLGCVGEDGYAHTLRKVMKEEGVQVRYMTTSTYPTGTCAVLLTNQGNQRSLVAHLAAAQQYTLPHLQLHWDWVTQAQCFYVEGYFLTVAYEAILQLAQYAATSKKIFAFNLSAPFVCALPTLPHLIPYCDFIFGNDVEVLEVVNQHSTYFSSPPSSTTTTTTTATTAATPVSPPPSSIKDAVQRLTHNSLPKHNVTRPRHVIITQGQDDVMVSTWDPVTQATTFQEYPIHPIDPKHVVDTNGAGDAFVGGFLSQLVNQKSLETCLKAGVWTAHKIIQVHGAEYPKHVEIPTDFSVLEIPKL